MGASPELLVARAGPGELPALRRIGAAIADPETDAANGRHWRPPARTVTSTNSSSTPCAPRWSRCAAIWTSRRKPQLSRTAALWHLSTPIRGHAARNLTTALDLALALHPTPAVGGVPTAAAVDLIAELEGDRGFYAGAVGWCDARGDGRWVVAIRGAQVSADRREALAQPAAVSWPNPIPTTKSPRPQRSSGPSCRRWESNNEPDPPGPSG